MVNSHDMSRPAWARGLKLISANPLRNTGKSRPAWARGLKHIIKDKKHPQYCRAPRGRVD